MTQSSANSFHRNSTSECHLVRSKRAFIVTPSKEGTAMKVRRVEPQASPETNTFSNATGRGIQAAATFEIGNEVYYVCRRSTTSNCCTTENAVVGRAVGQLTTKKGKFFIVSSAGKRSRSESDKDRQVQPLTARELQIVLLVAKGAINKEIADK